MDNSKFWLKYEPDGYFNLIELTNTQRAITNFVKILTKKEIKVEFCSTNKQDSFTNGKEITISSIISACVIKSMLPSVSFNRYSTNSSCCVPDKLVILLVPIILPISAICLIFVFNCFSVAMLGFLEISNMIYFAPNFGSYRLPV